MNWVELFTASGIWATLLAGFLYWLHARRVRREADLRSQLGHEAQLRFAGITAKIADLRQEIARIGSEIGDIHRRIDQLIQQVEWRRGVGGAE